MDSLTKENFWNDLHTKFPDQVDEFCKWIDEFKKTGEWVHFIQPHLKFHDLPLVLQVGILGKFFMEGQEMELSVTLSDYETIAKTVEDYFFTMWVIDTRDDED